MQMTAMTAIISHSRVPLRTRHLIVSLRQRGTPSRRTQVNDTDEAGCGQLSPHSPVAGYPNAFDATQRRGWPHPNRLRSS